MRFQSLIWLLLLLPALVLAEGGDDEKAEKSIPKSPLPTFAEVIESLFVDPERGRELSQEERRVAQEIFEGMSQMELIRAASDVHVRHPDARENIISGLTTGLNNRGVDLPESQPEAGPKPSRGLSPAAQVLKRVFVDRRPGIKEADPVEWYSSEYFRLFDRDKFKSASEELLARYPELRQRVEAGLAHRDAYLKGLETVLAGAKAETGDPQKQASGSLMAFQRASHEMESTPPDLELVQARAQQSTRRAFPEKAATDPETWFRGTSIGEYYHDQLRRQSYRDEQRPKPSQEDAATKFARWKAAEYERLRAYAARLVEEKLRAGDLDVRLVPESAFDPLDEKYTLGPEELAKIKVDVVQDPDETSRFKVVVEGYPDHTLSTRTDVLEFDTFRPDSPYDSVPSEEGIDLERDAEYIANHHRDRMIDLALRLARRIKRAESPEDLAKRISWAKPSAREVTVPSDRPVRTNTAVDVIEGLIWEKIEQDSTYWKQRKAKAEARGVWVPKMERVLGGQHWNDYLGNLGKLWKKRAQRVAIAATAALAIGGAVALTPVRDFAIQQLHPHLSKIFDAETLGSIQAINDHRSTPVNSEFDESVQYRIRLAEGAELKDVPTVFRLGAEDGKQVRDSLVYETKDEDGRKVYSNKKPVYFIESEIPRMMEDHSFRIPIENENELVSMRLRDADGNIIDPEYYNIYGSHDQGHKVIVKWSHGKVGSRDKVHVEVAYGPHEKHWRGEHFWHEGQSYSYEYEDRGPLENDPIFADLDLDRLASLNGEVREAGLIEHATRLDELIATARRDGTSVSIGDVGTVFRTTDFYSKVAPAWFGPDIPEDNMFHPIKEFIHGHRFAHQCDSARLAAIAYWERYFEGTDVEVRGATELHRDPGSLEIKAFQTHAVVYLNKTDRKAWVRVDWTPYTMDPRNLSEDGEDYSRGIWDTIARMLYGVDGDGRHLPNSLDASSPWYHRLKWAAEYLEGDDSDKVSGDGDGDDGARHSDLVREKAVEVAKPPIDADLARSIRSELSDGIRAALDRLVKDPGYQQLYRSAPKGGDLGALELAQHLVAILEDPPEGKSRDETVRDLERVLAARMGRSMSNPLLVTTGEGLEDALSEISEHKRENLAKLQQQAGTRAFNLGRGNLGPFALSSLTGPVLRFFDDIAQLPWNRLDQVRHFPPAVVAEPVVPQSCDIAYATLVD